MRGLIGLLVGFGVASVLWASRLPDQPVENKRMCIPLYDETGLECVEHDCVVR